MPLSKELQKQARLFVLEWNRQHPIDSAWRKEFNVPFGSKAHLEVDFIDQQIWFEEAEIIRKLREHPDATIDQEGRVIIPQEHDFGMDQEDIEKEFEGMSIKELNDKYGG